MKRLGNINVNLTYGRKLLSVLRYLQIINYIIIIYIVNNDIT